MSGAFLWVEWTTQNQVERAWEEARVFGAGSEMATKLQTEWRRMRDQRELY
jgi:hypothetical protein